MIDRDIEEYAEENSSPESSLLYNLNRETHLKLVNPRMLSGKIQGKFLEMISCMIKPKRILEVGTFTGYSAICLSAGLPEDGEIVTIDKNEELTSIADKYFEKAKIKSRLSFYAGDAVEIIPTLKGEFDLVFLDADKENYINYYKMIKPILSQGGFIVADNTLWSGKVLAKGKELDDRTLSIVEFNKFVNEDPETENVILPFRDGISLIRKL
ncbi:MAG: O-methyltransferase [Bacteroidales bacterium]